MLCEVEEQDPNNLSPSSRRRLEKREKKKKEGKKRQIYSFDVRLFGQFTIQALSSSSLSS